MRFARVAAHAIVAAVSTVAALRSTSEPRPPRGLKTASREIFAKRGSASRRRAAYAFVASRENAHAYEKARQDRQSLQTDPVGYSAGDLNLYAYVGNDPLNNSDPTGLEANTCSRVGAASCSGNYQTGGAQANVGTAVRVIVAIARAVGRIFQRPRDGANNPPGPYPVPPPPGVPAPANPYSGPLQDTGIQDPNAQALAERIGGVPSVRFRSDPAGREFDAVSPGYVAQTSTRPGSVNPGSTWRAQTRATFEAARATGRQPYFHIQGGRVSEGAYRDFARYAERYGVEPVIDFQPLP